MRQILSLSAAVACLTQGALSADLLLVSVNGEAKVSLFDLSTDERLADFSVDPGPHEIAISPDRRFAYVAITGTGPEGAPGSSINVLDLTRRETAARFAEVCERPHDVRVSSGGDRLFVACAPAEAVLELDAASGALVKEWTFGKGGGWFVEKSADDGALFVPLLEGEGLVMIDRQSGEKRKSEAGGQHGGVALTPDGKEVWIKAGGEIVVRDASTGERIAAIATPDQENYGRIAFTPDGSRAVFAHLGSKKVSTIDAKSRRIIETIELANYPKVAVVSSDGARAYISNPDTDKLAVLSLEPLAVVGAIEVGQRPDGLALFAKE